MAGLSLAAEVAELDGRLVEHADASGSAREPLRIMALEREWQFGYHTTGRSAATFLESYGSPEIRALTRASRVILDALGAESGEAILRTRPMVWVAREDQLHELNALLTANSVLRRVDVAGAQTLCPALRADYLAGAAVERGAQDIDVNALHESYRKRALAAGVVLRTAIGVEAGEWVGDGWRLTTDRGDVAAATVANASGAWADAIARRLGVAAKGLTPFRRTVAIVTTDKVPATWPSVSDVGDQFYFRPESGGLLVSPADETPSPPVDAKAEMEDVALALDRVNEATTLDLRRVRTSWAGLRTFAPDRNPVVGFDPGQPGFFWFAGQGGYGIQAAPALARLGASLLLDQPHHVPDLDVERLAPGRLVSLPDDGGEPPLQEAGG
jgi:D-arginine dehydrogenase